MNILNILNQISATSSRNEKEAILKANADNDLLKECFFLAYDPFTQFYIRKIPKYTPNNYPIGENLDWGTDQLVKMLASREVTGNAAIEHLQYVLEAVSADNAQVIERIIAKDLKVGATGSTANKVWPKLISEYPVMLCSAFDQKLVDKINFPAYAQMKMDGMRFNAIVRHTENTSSVEYRSRNGKELHLLGNLDDQFIILSKGDDMVFDGELLVMLEGDMQFADRQTGNGILNKANKGTISEKEAKLIHASLWDMIPYDDFIAGKSNVPYKYRWRTVQDLVKTLPVGKRIHTVYSVEVYTKEIANEVFAQLYAEGHEGIILKDMNGYWEDKRSKTQIKYKGELECDLKIVGIQPGQGKYEGMIGAIQCESSDGLIKVSVGSGFTDNQRKTLGDEIIGKITAVKYNARIVNRDGEHSLFLPVLIEIRDDKDEADHSKDVK